MDEKQFKNLIGGFGFESYEPAALETFNESLNQMMVKTMKGGRVSFPADYFGTPTKAWTDSPDGSNPSMSAVTDDVIRPELTSTFKVGGSTFLDDVTGKVFDKVLKQHKLGGGAPKKMKKEEKEEKKNQFKVLVDNLFKEVRKVAKKTKVLKVFQMKRASKKI
jgi:hypothetical protein